MTSSSKPSAIFAKSSISRRRYRSSSLSSASSPTSPLFSRSLRGSFEQSATLGSLEISTTVKDASSLNSQEDILGWLEAMRASSPRANCYMENHRSGEFQEAESQYTDWIQKHPSALRMFDKIIESANGKQVAVFLDYDGTLSNIVEDPDQAFMTELMRETVKDVAAHFPTSIITGRNRDKVFEFICLPELYYAGSHGMDIMGPVECCHGIIKADSDKIKDYKGHKVVLFQPASEFLPLMDQVCNILREKAKKFIGARVEHNKFCVTLHFRCVKEECWCALAEEVQKILQMFPNLSLTKGRKVLELRPSIEWHKGRALEFLLDALGLGCITNVLPVYIGDDRTDEDAFNVLKEKSFGCSILVAKVPKDTIASYSLKDPDEVMVFLQQLVSWKAATIQ